jgi:Asp-tRNA(Asn)/Glu-tRNA(Gln) amidotransferase B subunit
MIVIKENEKAVLDFKSGKQASIGYLVGQVMQKTKVVQILIQLNQF